MLLFIENANLKLIYAIYQYSAKRALLTILRITQNMARAKTTESKTYSQLLKGIMRYQIFCFSARLYNYIHSYFLFLVMLLHTTITTVSLS